MDSEFLDPDEEFDLIHEDEYELLREIEGKRTITLLPAFHLTFSNEIHD